MSEDIKAKALDIQKLVEYQDDTVVSREVIKKELGTVTFFAFDQGQGLSEHSAPFDAMVQIIDGEAEITISGVKNTVKKGEIIREFAVESLVYSETLQEWITHNGIDIKADKTTVVTSATRGKVKAIKNDPRYGLTVIISHDDGYETIYSNLLTAEFVVEGEEVEQGQTIGTVGSSAAFEISDDYHLHFELIKDNQYIDPTIYMSFE